MSLSSPNWQTELARLWKPTVVVLGIGRRDHGDDAAGPLLIDRLPAGADLVGIDCGTVPENFVGVAARHQPGLVLLVDACHTGAPAGTIHLLSPDQLAQTGLGTHGLTPALFLEMLQQETGVPCVVLAVEPARVGPDLPPSPCVQKALRSISDALRSHLPGPHTP